MNYDVFISHASEDKEAVVFPLAEALKQRGFTVWVDAFELLLGDSLRRKIDQGLAESRYGVVVLSHDFFKKEWTQRELDALVAREDGKEKVILPVWHNLKSEEVVRYSPILAAKLAISTSQGMDRVADAIARVLNHSAEAPTPLPQNSTPIVAGNTESTNMENRILAFLEGVTPSDLARVLARVPNSSAYMPYPGSHYERVTALVEFVKSRNGMGLEPFSELLTSLFPSFTNPR